MNHQCNNGVLVRNPLSVLSQVFTQGAMGSGKSHAFRRLLLDAYASTAPPRRIPAHEAAFVRGRAIGPAMAQAYRFG